MTAARALCDDDLALAALDPVEMIRLAWGQAAAAMRRARSLEALRWLRIQRDLEAAFARTAPPPQPEPAPAAAATTHAAAVPASRSSKVHCALENFSGPAADAPSGPFRTRAERRRAEAEARRRR